MAINELINTLLYYSLFGNEVWRYLIFIGVIISTFIIGKILNFIIKNLFKKFASKTETKFDDIIVETISPPLILFVSIFGFHLGYTFLQLSEGALKIFSRITDLLVIVGITWLIMRFLDALVENYIAPFTSRTESDLDDHLVPIIRKLLKGLIFVIAVLMILSEFGYNVTSILAGLGIGGLAFALAAQNMLANLFGGLTIFTDQPFKIGDRVRINNYDGFIRKIELRTSALETVDGTQVIIPNSKFTDGFIENVTREPARKVKFDIGLTYSTKPVDVEKAIKIISEIIAKQKHIVKDKTSVHFDEFAASSLIIKVIYFIDANGDWTKIYTTKHNINNEILSRFNKEGLEFAFPTQTIELHQKK